MHVHKETAAGVDILWISVGAAVTQAALASVLQLAGAWLRSNTTATTRLQLDLNTLSSGF